MSTMNIKGILLDNRYRIVDKIGVGGMADVYLGEDTLLGRQVAIKVLHANFANDDEFVTRFKREAQAAGKLKYCMLTLLMMMSLLRVLNEKHKRRAN